MEFNLSTHQTFMVQRQKSVLDIKKNHFFKFIINTFDCFPYPLFNLHIRLKTLNCFHAILQEYKFLLLIFLQTCLPVALHTLSSERGGMMNPRRGANLIAQSMVVLKHLKDDSLVIFYMLDGILESCALICFFGTLYFLMLLQMVYSKSSYNICINILE